MSGIEDIEINEEINNIKHFQLQIGDKYLVTELEIDNITSWDDVMKIKEKYGGEYILLLLLLLVFILKLKINQFIIYMNIQFIVIIILYYHQYV